MAKTSGDGDEVRRLGYMALRAPETKRYELVGTLVNALVHHLGVKDLTPDEVGTHIRNVVDGTDPGKAGETWLRAQIARITKELGD